MVILKSVRRALIAKGEEMSFEKEIQDIQGVPGAEYLIAKIRIQI